MNKINVVSLFDGLAGARIALDRLGISCNYYASEIDKYAIKIAMKNYPDIIQLGDVSKIKYFNGTLFHAFGTNQVPQIDLLIGGSPCFVSNTKIITDKGYKNIKDIRIGDFVLTHKNRFKEVLKVGSCLKNIYVLKAQGIKNTGTTANHPYYVRTMLRKWNNSKRKYIRVFSKPRWKKIKNLNKHDYVGLPILNKEENKFNLSQEDCWLLGRYVADGHLRKTKRKNRKCSFQYQVVYSVGKHKVKDFKQKIKNRHFSCYPHTKSTYRCVFSSMDFLNFIKENNFGEGAINKKIPQFILNLPNYLCLSFLKGYMSGDGCFTNNKYKATSISDELIMGLNLLIAKIYKTNSSFDFTKRPKKTKIEGRIVNQHNTYSANFNLEMKKQTHAKVINNIIWLPIKKINKINQIKRVYNLEVKDDNSYTANNVFVHNCQDLSIAKKNREGLKGDRSGLFYEYVRLLKELKPKYFVLENVNSMSKANKQIITDILGVEPIMINSALLTAQNRKRLYWTNIEGIKQPEDKHIYLKDILESGNTEKLKSYCIDANYWKGTNLKQYLKKHRRQIVYIDIPFALTETRTEKAKKIRQEYRRLYGKDFSPRRGKELKPRFDNKSNCLTTGCTKEHLLFDGIKIRKLTPLECERLQGLDDNYTEGVSNTQRYKMIGNGFTIPVIEHILKGIKKGF